MFIRPAFIRRTVFLILAQACLVTLVHANTELLRGPVEFEIGLSPPRLQILNTIIAVNGESVTVDARLRYNDRGKIECSGDCAVDGIPVTAKGSIKLKGGEWTYKLVLKSSISTKVVVKINGTHGSTIAKCSYKGPRGKVTIKENRVVVGPALGTVSASVVLYPTISPTGKITGTGTFSGGFGDTSVEARLTGKIVGDYLSWNLKNGRRKLSFEGFLQGNAFVGSLKIKLLPEKSVQAEYRFPDNQSEEEFSVFEVTKQVPFVLRFRFQLLDLASGSPITPRSNGFELPTREDFTISEDGAPIDAFETNQFLSSGRIRQLDAVLILDYTGSMAQTDSICPMEQAAKTFISVQEDNTNLALVAFYERQGGRGVISPLTTCDAPGKQILTNALENFEAPENGATEIWDTVDLALDQFSAKSSGEARAVIFLTDGRDTSSLTRPELIRDRARDLDVRIYPLGINVDSDFVDDLQNMAKATGGQYFSVGPAASTIFGCDGLIETDLDRLFKAVSDRLGGDWFLSYVTLQQKGLHWVTVESDYRDVDLKFTETFAVDTELDGDIRQGILTCRETPSTDAQKTIYTVSADYIPRSITRLDVRIETFGPAFEVPFLDSGLLTAESGWTAFDRGYDAEQGGRLIAIENTAATPLRYGAFGSLFRIEVQAPDAPVTLTIDNSGYSGEKHFVFDKPDGDTVKQLDP